MKGGINDWEKRVLEKWIGQIKSEQESRRKALQSLQGEVADLNERIRRLGGAGAKAKLRASTGHGEFDGVEDKCTVEKANLGTERERKNKAMQSIETQIAIWQKITMLLFE